MDVINNWDMEPGIKERNNINFKKASILYHVADQEQKIYQWMLMAYWLISISQTTDGRLDGKYGNNHVNPCFWFLYQSFNCFLILSNKERMKEGHIDHENNVVHI